MRGRRTLARSRAGSPARTRPPGGRSKSRRRPVALRPGDGAAVGGRYRLDQPVVAPDDLEPGPVAEAGEHRCRVDDVGEHDRDRAIDGQRGRQVRPLALDRPLKLVERDGERLAEGLQIRSRERPVDMDDLPLPALEVEDVARARLECFALPVDQLLHPGPADRPFLPGLDLGGRDREGAGLLHLSGPDRAGVAAPKPRGRVGADHQGASWSESPPRYASSSPAAIAIVHRSMTRRISSEGSTRRMVRHRCRGTQPAVRGRVNTISPSPKTPADLNAEVDLHGRAGPKGVAIDEDVVAVGSKALVRGEGTPRPCRGRAARLWRPDRRERSGHGRDRARRDIRHDDLVALRHADAASGASVALALIAARWVS